VSESCWIRNLLLELHCPVIKATLVYCDSVSALYVSYNSVQLQHTKHVVMGIHNTLCAWTNCMWSRARLTCSLSLSNCSHLYKETYIATFWWS